jgi:hypothetical protein
MKTRKNRGGEGSFSDAAMSARRGVARSVSFVGDKAMKAAVFTKDVSGRGFSAGLSLTKTLMDVGSDLTVRGIISPMTTMISIALPKAKTQLLKIKPIILPMLEKFENDDLTTVVLKMFDLLIDSVNKAKLVSITTWKPVFTEFIAMVKHVDVDDFQDIIDAIKLVFVYFFDIV